MFYIVRQVLAQPQITEQSIYGVVSAYMMIGLIFAAVYLAMFSFSHQFFVHGPNDTKTFQYFSFTTLTTLGYGDFTAASDAGRAVAVLEAMVGQMFLATLVARLVAGFRWSDRAAARHGRVQAAPGANQEPQASETGSGPGESRVTAAPLPPGSGEPGAGRAGHWPASIRLQPVPGEEGHGTRPDPAQPARDGARAGNRAAPGRAEGGRAVRPGPRPSRRADLNPAVLRTAGVVAQVRPGGQATSLTSPPCMASA